MKESGSSSQQPQVVNSVGAFWSYAHEDDHDGRLSQLAQDLATEYAMITGDRLDLFVDKEGIKWGDRWRLTIDVNIAERMSFIAILSPRYFLRPECRREIKLFIEDATNLGLRELFLPLYYVECASIEDKDPVDDLAKQIKEFQYEDWRQLRLADTSSEPYRRGVNKLASRLASVNQAAERWVTPGPTIVGVETGAAASGDGEEEEGTLDRLATMEEALPEWSTILKSISAETKAIIKKMEAASLELKKHTNSTFKHKRAIASRMAREMNGPVDRLEELAPGFVEKTYEVDAGIRVLVPQAAVELGEDHEHREALLTVFDEIRKLSETMDGALLRAEQANSRAEKMEVISRDLRPVVRRWRQTLTAIVEVRGVVGGWSEYLDAAGVP